MQKIFLVIIIIIVGSYSISSCKKDPKCDPITVTTTKVLAGVGATNGKIIVTSPKGAGYSYSINSGAFQADSVFSNLAIGSYTITAKINSCTGVATVDLPNPCTSTVTVLTSKFDAITGQTNGSITVTSPVGTGYTYSINNGAFQASTNFSNLAAGVYTLKAKTNLGCEGTASTTLNSYGPKYHAVKQLVLGYCGPCHLNGGNSGAVNFDTDATIVAKWDRIKARAVDNLPTVMPQSGPITTIDKQKITDWVNAGHTINN
jgi:hypothetical protein